MYDFDLAGQLPLQNSDFSKMDLLGLRGIGRQTLKMLASLFLPLFSFLFFEISEGFLLNEWRYIDKKDCLPLFDSDLFYPGLQIEEIKSHTIYPNSNI